MNKRTLFLQMTASILARSGRLGTAFGRRALGLMALLALGMSSPAAHAQNYHEQTLSSFGGTNGDGTYPYAGLTNVNGIFYGTTEYGGANGYGTVFSYDPSTNTETPLYSFTNTQGDGAYPYAALTYDTTTKKLYGTTEDGGYDGDGTVFSFDPASSIETPIYSFGFYNANEGNPAAAIVDVNGILYGTTQTGGYGNDGTVFSFSLSTNAENTLYSFTTSNPFSPYPQTDLTYDSVTGKLYGITPTGGTNSEGTIFSIDPSSEAVTTLYSFAMTTGDGARPYAGLCDVNGIFYGTTEFGGANGYGTVFSYDPSTNTETPLYSFTNTHGDGAYPYAALTYDTTTKKLFGTTEYGGTGGSFTNGYDGDGTVFSFDPASSIETPIYSFQGGATDGLNPQSGLLDVGGIFYGTTQYGGSANKGTLFSLTPIPPPIAANDTYAPKFQTAYAVHAPGVLANDNAKGNGPLTATLVSQPTHGTLTLNSDGSFTYTPSAGFVGTDTFTYQDSASLSTSNIATVSMVVQASVPTAHNDAYVPTYNKAYAVKAPGVLANDYNGDNQPMTATLVTGPAHGSLTFNSDGSFLYTPNTGFAGSDTFTYQAVNDIGTSNTATVTLTIAPIKPIAHNDTYAPKYQTAYVVKAPGILANDDAGGDPPLYAIIKTSPGHGTLTLHYDGSFTYTPAAGFVGQDSFTYNNQTLAGSSNMATVTLNVYAAVPIAHNDAYAVTHNRAYVVSAVKGVLVNDYAGDTGSLTAALVTSVSHGTLTFNSDGSFTYTPANGFTGADTFTYYATNGVGSSNTATVTLNVQ